MNVPANAHPPNPPSNTYHPNTRVRSNTINNLNNMDAIPPALARLQHMNHDVISGRNALTPVLNRDDAMREWERRQAGKAATAQTYQPLEFLQQQAELAAASGYTNWNQPRTMHRFHAQPSSLSHSYQPASVVMDDPSDRREVVMSSVRSAPRGDQQQPLYSASSSTTNLPSPPQAYVANSNPSSARYTTSFNQQQQQAQQSQPQAPFDALERGRDMSSMYVPMQPDSYSSPSA